MCVGEEVKFKKDIFLFLGAAFPKLVGPFVEPNLTMYYTTITKYKQST